MSAVVLPELACGQSLQVKIEQRGSRSVRHRNGRECVPLPGIRINRCHFLLFKVQEQLDRGECAETTRT